MTNPKSSDADDLAMVSRVLQGERAAYRDIVDKYQDRIFRVCYAHLGQREEAEDAVQEVFLRAYKSLHRFKLEKRFVNWLYAIAINHLKTRYSRILKFQEKQDRLFNEPDPPDETPERVAERQMLKQSVQQAIRSLPPKLKQPVTLYYLEELDVQDIASILGIGRENVKSRLFRARKKLRQLLEKDATG